MLNKFYQAVTNRSGDALPGYYVRLFDSTGTQVTLYADESMTPIISVSGKADAAVANDNGMVSFWHESGIYDVRYYDANDEYKDAELGVPLIRAATDVADLSFTQSGDDAVSRTMEAKAREIVSVKDFGATADGSTNDYTFMLAARDACWAADLATLAIPDGTYAFGTKLELSKDHWACIPAGENAKLKHTGGGVAVSLSGPSDDATYGTYRGTLGGEKPLVIEGNASTTRLLELDNYHHGNVNVDLKNGQVGVYITDSIGNSSSAGAVLTKFRVRVSQGNDGAFTTVPATGFYASEIYACECHLIIEHCGGSGNFGVYLNSSAANVFYGTSEGNVSGGVLIASNSYRNTFLGFFCEDNGTGFDWDIRGDYNRLVNCTGVSASGSEISGDYCVVEGGKLKNLTITSGAAYTVLDGVALEGTFTDSSTTTTVRNCTLDGTPIADYAPRAGGAPTLGTNISNYALTDSTYQAPAYFRLPNGLGEVLGTFAATGAISIGDTIATIPSGYRPAKRITFTGYNISTNAVMGITIDSSGNVVTRTAIANGNVFGFGSPQFPRA